MRRIIIRGLRPEFRGFVTAIQGWPTQPSLIEFENLLVGQEAMAKKMGGVSLKLKNKALYSDKGKEKLKYNTGNGSRRDEDRRRGHQGISQ